MDTHVGKMGEHLQGCLQGGCLQGWSRTPKLVSVNITLTFPNFHSIIASPTPGSNTVFPLIVIAVTGRGNA